MGICITFLQATEVIYRARGPELEKSDKCDISKVIDWFKDNMIILRPKPEHNLSYDLTGVRNQSTSSVANNTYSKIENSTIYL